MSNYKHTNFIDFLLLPCIIVRILSIFTWLKALKFICVSCIYIVFSSIERLIYCASVV